ncbi:hypothetical protein DXG01_006458, partial [Tephrocybe rancida]
SDGTKPSAVKRLLGQLGVSKSTKSILVLSTAATKSVENVAAPASAAQPSANVLSVVRAAASVQVLTDMDTTSATNVDQDSSMLPAGTHALLFTFAHAHTYTAASPVLAMNIDERGCMTLAAAGPRSVTNIDQHGSVTIVALGPPSAMKADQRSSMAPAAVGPTLAMNIDEGSFIPKAVISHNDPATNPVSLTNINQSALPGPNVSQDQSKFKDGVNVALDGFLTALRVAKDSSDWNPFLKAVLGGVVAIIDLAKTVSNNLQDMKDTLACIQGLLPILETSAKRLEGRKDGFGKGNNLMAFAITMQAQLEKIQQMQSHGPFRHVLQGSKVVVYYVLLMRDPNLDVCPDFSSAPFEPTRALMRATGMTDKEAVTSLQEAWTTHNDAEQDHWEQETEAWNSAAAQGDQGREGRQQQQQHQQPPPEPQQQQAEPQPADEELTECEHKARLKLRVFNPQMRVGNTLAPRPSSYAINKLSNFEYCELWYFSMEGCEDALRELVTLRPVASVQASKRVIQDEELSWEQFHYAHRGFIQQIIESGWPEEHTQALLRFFIEIENSPFVTRENGKKVLLVYAAHVRRDWMDLMKGGGDVFNIALINDELLESVSREIQSKLTADLQHQMSDALENIKLANATSNTSAVEHTPRKMRTAHEGAAPYQKRVWSPTPASAQLPARRTSGPAKAQGEVFGSGTGMDGPSACVVCLGRNHHNISKCNSKLLHDGTQARCRQNERGRLVNPKGLILCSDWQRPQGCNSTSSIHIHKCSGCGRKNHGAQACPQTQKL